MTSIRITEDPEGSRYEARLQGRLVGFAEHRRAGDAVILPRTVVLPEAEGQGIGSALARRALADAREQGLRVVPACSFIAEYIQRHPEYADLVVDED